MCGFTYNISVIAVNSVCNVSQSVMKQLQAVPCVPQQVEARVVCESDAVAVSWEPSKGALFYETVAQGNNGYISTCKSIETTCLLVHMLCGLNYSITVSASDDNCVSAQSSPVEIDTVPCAPQKVRAEMVCSNDTAVVSWEEGEGVSSFKVWAFGPDGHKTECTSTETSCELPSMHCGQLYNLTVTAQDGRCDNSNAYLNLQSAPCKPTSVKASLRCRSNSVAVTWERASGALSYLAAGVTADGSLRAECNNTATHCDLSELRCGRTYDVSVFGRDESCSGAESDTARVRTAPCVPQNVTVHQRCADKAMVVSWSPNPDAQSFHVTAVSDTRARLYCNSTGTSCTLRNLPCGQSYNVTVRSERDGCESEPGAAVETSSAPCTPMNPEARLDCVSNSAWVIWSESRGATGYSVVAREAGGHSSNCTSGSSPCSVPDLKCGSNYTFHVTAANTDCRSNHRNAFNLETGPCGLKSISAVTECNNDTILVEWETTVDAPLYLVTAEADDDDRTLLSCNSSSDSCVLKDVRCATHYSIIVSSDDDKCSSLRSPPKKIKTAPCVPGNVTVTQLCGTNDVEVAWENSLVATRYQLTATGRDGRVHFYNTTTNNCSLPDLHCGETYRLIITAVGDNCVGPPSTSTFRTVPCTLSGLSVVTDCQTKSAVLSWMASEGAVGYVGRAEAPERDPVYCESTSLSCTIEHLECGGLYNFSVKALDGVCMSSFSAPVQAGVAPCAPDVLKVRMLPIDERHWIMMSWDRVNCSDVEYQATVIGRIENNPQALLNFFSYWLPRPYFEMPMPCSTSYNITLRARNSGGVSEPSGVHSRVTVPCPPQNLQYSRDGRSAVLSWDASLFATSYTVYGVSGESRERLCSTTGLSCSIRNFVPSATEVTASNAEGESGANAGPVEARRKRDLQEPWLLVLSEDDPEIPEVTVTVTGRTLYVKWTTAKDASEYRLVIEEELSGRPAVERDVAGDSYVETDLKPRTTYCVTVVAKNGMNQSSRPKCLNSGAS
ncbi:fibronectin type III domain-containing protein 7-like [Embiotoca jacksoni]|uniref:fibronectin type III domain-containing protein 7-like n=1 Tax=Embiotoca jacksoni TaxID=100190 RepID=UPI003703A514